jgi:hypothetical protein
MLEALAMKQTDPDDNSAQARELSAMWRHVSRQHLTSGQACACGFGGGLMLQGAAFELDIVEFLIDDARKAGFGGLEAFIDATAKRGPDNYSLTALINALGVASSQVLSDAEASFALSRLRRTLASMDEAHSRGKFTCD